jgi:hypothetical protein
MQSVHDFELWVIGDNCTDDTAEVVRSVGSERVKWHNLDERWRSQSGPNNAGIERAAAPFVAYLGHDDIWAPNHLEAMLNVLRSPQAPDFVASGTIYHLQPGVPLALVHGLLDRPGQARVHFLPPSGLAHRKDVTERIGGWRRPGDIRAPVDSDFVLRAVEAGMSFESTGIITVHKFAAGHRYLSYLRQESTEQEAVLELLSRPGADAFVARSVELARQTGRYMNEGAPDFSMHQPGELATRNLTIKGLARPPLVPLGKGVILEQRSGFYEMDWANEPENGIRWSTYNPNPKILLTVTGERAWVSFSVYSEVEGLTGIEIVGARRPLVSAEIRSGSLYCRTYTFLVQLAADAPSIVDLKLRPEQTWKDQERHGTGIGPITIVPAGVPEHKLAKARETTARLRRKLASITSSRGWRLLEALRRWRRGRG